MQACRHAGHTQPAFITSNRAIAPIESMPIVFKYLSLFNPLRHYVTIVRGILLKDVGLEVLWSNAIALLLFATVLLSVSINRFRRQLS